MVLIGLVTWWYSTGWLTLLQKIRARITATLGFFSVGLLVGSLFAPFKQISAGRVDGPLSVQLQAWGDRLFSRFVGFVVRSLLILLGIAVVVVVAIVGLMLAILWPVVPFAPAAGLILMGMAGQ